MSAASDKARFYLEQYVPELQSYERKGIFTRAEIASITAKRSDFEHTLNARGSKPSDYAQYASYEANLSTLLKKRCKRLGVKGTKKYSGQRTIFFILDRGTRKFPGDMGLWMQYIRFCQKEGASKKLAKVFTQLLRLKPREWGLWVLAAKWYAEEQGDMSTSRSYMQRGLRFCKDERKLWLEYLKLEMVYLAKLAARRKVLGLDEDGKKQEAVQQDEDENMISLPTITAADVNPDASKGIEEVDDSTLQRLAKAPAFTGAIPIAIFDAAMKQFHNNAEVAEDFFELVATFDSVPSAKKILQHILSRLQTTSPNTPEAVICEARMQLFSIDLLSADFPTALGMALARVKAGMAAVSEKQRSALADKAVLMLLPYVQRHAELDEDVATVIVASTNRYLRIVAAAPKGSKAKVVKAFVSRAAAGGMLSGEQILDVCRELKEQG